MADLTYLEISYPNFVLGAIIDPEEANQNNFDLQTKINDTITKSNLIDASVTNLGNTKANITYVDGKVTALNTSITTNANKLDTHKTSTDHDDRYYIKSLAATKDELSVESTRVNAWLNNLTDNKANKVETYTKAELAPWLRGGDTTIREEVFSILNPNLGDGTFSYTSNGETIIGLLGEGGEQIFTLRTGNYELELNRIEAMINDTLRRSVKSGGLREVDSTSIELTSPEGSGAEITFKYYERVGMAAEYNIKLSPVKPPFNFGKNMWFEVI